MACKQTEKRLGRAIVAGLACCVGFFCSHAAQGAISYGVPESLFTENFDTLPFSPTNTSLQGTGGWIDDTVSPVGNFSIPGFYLWHPTASATEGGANLRQRVRAGSGNSSIGAFYSFGVNGSTERALGMLNSAALTPNGADAYIALRLTNNTGVTLNSFSLSYNGEQYRTGDSTGETLAFAYSTTATDLDWNSTAAYTSVPALSFTAPVIGPAGIVTGSVTPISATVGFSWAPGTDLWLRWADTQLLTLADDGLAIDDLQFSASTAAGPSLFVNSVTSGLASSPSTWSNGQAPSPSLTYNVVSGHVVTINAAFAGNELRVLNGGAVDIAAGGNGQAINGLLVEAGGNVTKSVSGDLTIGSAALLNNVAIASSALGQFQTDQNLTFNMDPGSDLGIAMRLRGTGNIDVNTTGSGSQLILAGAADQTGTAAIRFNGTGDAVRLVKDQGFNRVEMNSTGANAFIYENTAQAAGGVLTYNQNGVLDHASTAAGARIAQPSVLNVTDKTVTVDLSKSYPTDERRLLIESTLQGTGAIIINGAATDPTNLASGGTNGITLNEFELGTQTEPTTLANNSFSGTLTANGFVNVELRNNLRGAAIVINQNAVLDMGHPVVGSTKVMQFGEINVNNGGTLEVGFEASIAGQQIGRHVSQLELVSTNGRSGSLTLADGSTTVMQINGLNAHEYDTISAQGSIALNGTLKVVINPLAFTGVNTNYNPTPGDVIPLITTTGSGFLPADFNQNGVVDAADLTTWKGAFGVGSGADANSDGVTDGSDFLIWQRTFGNSTGISGTFDAIVVEDPGNWMAGKTFQVLQTATSFSLVVVAAVAAVPEPSTALLAGICLGGLAWRRRR